ncbi:hypothetical protein GCM10010260_54060 [Streptomyces filipinensis]|uniref:Uncharacterized protein n=1 Tax=Streptomyces filipinensis TaxID=66887 RepID=A0A918IEW6_9ACTN|nr:hypothetical protein [Streptomyces filipinensis]GGV09100.1 hypothetical protein GCM10010260_54060 [Streptomyces filipinensis]
MTLAYNLDTLPFPENRVPRARPLTNWDDVDPSRHPFTWDEDEEAHLRALVREWVPPVLSGREGRWQGEHWCERQVDALIRERYGSWAQGWNWCYRYGGVIGSWVTAVTSVTTPDETAARVVTALLEWREWLERLARRFAELAPPPDAPPEDRSWHLERACVRLVTLALDSGAEGGWHGQAALVLRWFLTTTGMGHVEAGQAVEAAIGGRFESWVTPGHTLIESVGEDLAVGLTGHAPYRDHREWSAVEEFHDRH